MCRGVMSFILEQSCEGDTFIAHILQVGKSKGIDTER